MSFVSLYLYVPDEGSLLPKYRDCTTSNDFELYIYIYVYIIQQLVNKCRFLETTLLNYAYPCRNWTFQRFARAA